MSPRRFEVARSFVEGWLLIQPSRWSQKKNYATLSSGSWLLKGKYGSSFQASRTKDNVSLGLVAISKDNGSSELVEPPDLSLFGRSRLTPE